MFNFAAVLDHNAARNPDKVVLSMGARHVTNRELLARVNALAAALCDSGIRPGERVALLMNNSIEFLEAVLAINRIGAVFLPLNTRLAADEWKFVLTHSGAKAVVAEHELQVEVETALDALTELTHRILVGGSAASPWIDYDRLIASNAGRVVPVADVDERDVHRLVYTSGTTSRPKGVPLTHRNTYWKNYSQINELHLGEHDRTLVVGPMYHVGGYDIPAIDTFHAGGSLVIVRRFDAAEILQIIAREKPTNTWMAPSMLSRIMDLPEFEETDTSSLRLIIFGAEKSSHTFVKRLISAFPQAWVSDGYGLSETSSGIAFNDSAHALSKAGAVGRPILHAQVRVIDDDGADVNVGELGEIAVRGPMVFEGYFRDTDATQAAFHDGWFLTGDVGRFDEDGYLYLEDRKKDMIKSGGENIASAEVERVVAEHPGVLENAVVGVPDPRWGEVPRAFVVRRDGVDVGEQELKDFCRSRLARFKVPASVVFVSSLPRNSGGKVLKRVLRERE